MIIREAQTLLISEEITFEMDEDEFVQLRTATGCDRNPELYGDRTSCVNSLTIKGDVFTSSRSLIGDVRNEQWAGIIAGWHKRHNSVSANGENELKNTGPIAM